MSVVHDFDSAIVAVSIGAIYSMKLKLYIFHGLLLQLKPLFQPLRDFDALIFNFFHDNFVIRDNARLVKDTLYFLDKLFTLESTICSSFVGFNLPDAKDRSPHQRYIMYMLDPVVHAMNDQEVTADRINGEKLHNKAQSDNC